MKPQSNQADPVLIKNPFICNSARQVRLSLDKDPRRFKGDTQFTQEIPLENGNTILENQIDRRLSYVLGKAEMKPLLSTIDKYDYQISAETLNKSSKVKHTEGLPLSFIQIKNENEGIEWYAKNFPKLPDELLPIIARYHWGAPITKKGLKKEKKKIEHKLQKKGITIQNKPVVVKFD
tara:strand:+ start:309 stop:842 length:534 start_codon:yes stop_codon:yes gene_type:complete